MPRKKNREEGKAELPEQQEKIKALEAIIGKMTLESNEFKQKAAKAAKEKDEALEDLELDKEELVEAVKDLEVEVRSQKAEADSQKAMAGLEKSRLDIVTSMMKTGLLSIENTIQLAKAIKSDGILDVLVNKYLQDGAESVTQYFLEHSNSKESIEVELLQPIQDDESGSAEVMGAGGFELNEEV